MMKRGIVASLAVLAGVSFGETCTWTGAWDVEPQEGDAIVIASGDLTWKSPLPLSVASWTQNADYTGTVTFDTGLETFAVTGDVTLNGGTWTHTANPSFKSTDEGWISGRGTKQLIVSCGGNFTINPGATINVEGKGYAGSQGPGHGGGGTGGASHGGSGYLNSGLCYGSPVTPVTIGSAVDGPDLSGLTYEWTIDGVVVAGAEEDSITLTDTAIGAHTVGLTVSNGAGDTKTAEPGTFKVRPCEVFVSLTGSNDYPYNSWQTAATNVNEAFTTLWKVANVTSVLHLADGEYPVSEAMIITTPFVFAGAGVDRTVLKAAKLTLSGVVPIVGSMISDASETVIVGAQTVKNSVGILGMLAVIAICIGPFVRIGVQYCLIRLAAAAGGALGPKPLLKLMDSIGEAMGFLLAMTGTAALMLLISCVCYLKVAPG